MEFCSLCGAGVEKLAKSHVFPDFVTKRMVVEGRPVAAVPIKPTAQRGAVKKQYGGIYDRFACSDCESQIFRAGDNFFARFYSDLLASRTSWEPMSLLPLPSLKFRCHATNGALVHRFVVQTLLRAHLARASAVANFDLGDAFESLRSLCLQDPDGVPDCFHVATFSTRDPRASILMGPVTSGGEYPTARFWIPQLTFLVATSDAGLPPVFRKIQISNDAVPIYHTRRFDVPEIAWLHEAMSNHGDAVEQLHERHRVRTAEKPR